MLKVCKFGGTSLADANQFKKVQKIVKSDPSRRVIVVSALGKRHPQDQKITDLLYALDAELKANLPCFQTFEKIRHRYLEIEKALSLSCSIDTVSTSIYAKLSNKTSTAYLVSRGEYLAAKLMAAYLGFTFVDATRWLFFDNNGDVDESRSAEALKSLAKSEPIVTPGFYGLSDSGEIRLFSRGGSDITGALCAKFPDADEYENWTDVNGLLTANPYIIQNPKTVKTLSYDDLITLSRADLQVLHASSILPVKEKSIPLSIRNTNDPDGNFTRICDQSQNTPPLILAQKEITDGCSLVIAMVSGDRAKTKLAETLRKVPSLFSIYHAPCYYILCKKEAENACIQTLYDSIYKKGSLE